MGWVKLIQRGEINRAAYEIDGKIANRLVAPFVECVAPTRKKLLFVLRDLNGDLGHDLSVIGENVTDSNLWDRNIDPDGIDRDVPKITYNGIIYGIWSKGEIDPQIIEKQFPRFPYTLQISSAKVFHIWSQTEKFDVVVFFDHDGSVRWYCQFPEYAYVVWKSLPMDVSHNIYGFSEHAKIIHDFAKELGEKRIAA